MPAAAVTPAKAARLGQTLSTPSNSEVSSLLRLARKRRIDQRVTRPGERRPGSASSWPMPWHLCMLRASLPISVYVVPSSGS